MSDEAEQLIRLEHARCLAISEGDLESLGRILSADLTHTHATGRSQDREAYLSALQGRPRATRRTEDLRVRLYGETAVMTGTLLNTFPATEPEGPERQVELHALQVWALETSQWKLVAFASSGPRSS
jgi:ketosteroid isomerase-like protein